MGCLGMYPSPTLYHMDPPVPDPGHFGGDLGDLGGLGWELGD